MAGTAAGIISTDVDALSAPAPPNGNIFERLDAHRISWKNYHSDVPSVAILLEYALAHDKNIVPISQFFTDAASGNLPSFCIVDPTFNGGSEENPDDIRIGEQFCSQIINAAMAGPGWKKTLLVWLYDEHGGYYDHIPPPSAVAPDDIPPDLAAGDLPGGYNRYGFRVPAVIASPYAKRGYVSSVVRDHTAILKLVERKWNLASLTRRDAAADDFWPTASTSRTRRRSWSRPSSRAGARRKESARVHAGGPWRAAGVTDQALLGSRPAGRHVGTPTTRDLVRLARCPAGPTARPARRARGSGAKLARPPCPVSTPALRPAALVLHRVQRDLGVASRRWGAGPPRLGRPRFRWL